MVRIAASLALVAVLASSTTACAMSRGSRTSLIVAGVTAAVVGGVMLGMDPAPVDADHDGINETTLDDDYSDVVLAVVHEQMGNGHFAS